MIVVMLGVVMRCLLGMFMGMQVVGMRQVGMVSRLVMVASLVVVRSLLMMLGGGFVVMGGLAMMVSALM